MKGKKNVFRFFLFYLIIDINFFLLYRQENDQIFIEKKRLKNLIEKQTKKLNFIDEHKNAANL